MASPLIPPAVSAVGYFKAFLTTLSFFPQNLKILRLYAGLNPEM